MDDNTHGLRFAIIENEFGDVGVDEKILSEKTDEEVIEVMNGCICCTVRGDLVIALKKLHKKIAKFDAVIIETTGLADPAPVAQTFFIDDEIQSKYYLDGIITVVDSKHIMARLDDEKPEGVENEAEEQVRMCRFYRFAESLSPELLLDSSTKRRGGGDSYWEGEIQANTRHRAHSCFALQVAFADRILINKTDLVKQIELDNIEKRLKRM